MTKPGITEFLQDRLAEQRALALATQSYKWDACADFVEADNWDGELPNVIICTAEDEPKEARAIHIAYWDPARVLAECDAKQKIIDEHKTVAAAYPGRTIETDPCCDTCSASGEYPGEFPCWTLRALAAPDSRHSDYDESWRP